MIKHNWHVQSISEVLNSVDSGEEGLTSKEANFRLQMHGANEIELFKKPSVILRFLRQFHNILIYVLLMSAIITTFLGHYIDASVIMAVVILNAIFGFIQEGKAEQAIDAIRDLLAPNANIIRDGRHLEIPARELVQGDIILLKSGDKVPADLRLIKVKNLQVQEAILTGESNAIEKNIEPVNLDSALGDRFNMAYSGTTITYGKGMGVVVAIGVNTEIGKISTMLKNIEPITTPFLRQINVFGKWLTVGILGLAIFTLLVGVLFWHDSIDNMFMAAVGLAVAAIPEGLPPLLTIILAIGVTRMAKRQAIIRQLPAVETMGAVTTICTDKTGTLTRNEQTVKVIVTTESHYHVEDGDNLAFSLNDERVEFKKGDNLFKTINTGILCTDAEFFQDNKGVWHIYGNPIDKALLELGGKASIDLNILQKEYPRTDLIPYESEHKFMATLHRSHESQNIIYIKGAPENILDRCSYEIVDGETRDLDHKRWHQCVESLAMEGYRVIALAIKQVPADKQALLFSDVEDGLTLVAIFGLIDAPRPEAAQAVEECRNASIRVKMITGDHAFTAATVGAEVGINSKNGVLTGSDIDKLSDEELREVVSKVDIYARTSPHHKLRLVEALQANGEMVAMTGDGVNDAPALRKANIGVAMGRKGAEITKESAAMVLADDNFATIVHAVEEGRVVYDNLKKVIVHILPTNAAEAFVVVMAIVLGMSLPITPAQILWVNMITAVTVCTALGFEPGEDGIMQRAPRRQDVPILSKFLIWRILFVAALLVICIFGLFIAYNNSGGDIAISRTIAVNMLVVGEAVYLFNCRKLYAPAWRLETLFSSRPAIIATVIVMFFQVLFTYLPIMQKFFGTAAMSMLDWVYIIALGIIIFILVEFEKIFIRRLKVSS